MATKLLDYRLDAISVSNPDSTLPTTFQNTTVAPGPGAILGLDYPSALDFDAQGRGIVDVGGIALDAQRFAVRVVFRADGPVAARQNLVESTRLPFALFLLPRAPGEFDIAATVRPSAHGWRGVSTRFAAPLQTGVWYVADLVYDLDTVAVFINETIVSVHAFSNGAIAEQPGHELFIGTWTDGVRDQFDGQMAAVGWLAGVPEPLAAQLDERRTSPEWFMSYKLEALRSGGLDLGEPASAMSFVWSIGAYFQEHEHGALMYHDSLGCAFEMHGAIYERYRSLRGRSSLGYLVSDEVFSTNRAGRKSVFSRGAIYWSRATGAVPVHGQIYLDYEALGEARAIGFPTAGARPIANGLEQRFERARMYHKNGQPNAHEVHGAILAKYLALGGPAVWGFPITHEIDVRKRTSTPGDRRNRFQTVGRASEFERCTIFWSSATGAFEVHGDIRAHYLSLMGPAGELGFPLTDEIDIPGAPGGRCSAFQHGTLLWYGSAASIVLARPFRVRLGRINSKESEGFLMGQNDLYIYLKLVDGTQTVFNQRLPSSGDWGGDNIVDVNFTIPAVVTPFPGKSVTLTVDVREADPGPDDHLGVWTKVLNEANGFGLRENGGILHSGEFSKINSITASVQPIVDIDALSEQEKFWGVANKGTDVLSYQQYAAAFSDVDSDTEWWDVTDWLDKAFYELVVKGLAKSGNCFGMSLEAINSRKGASLYSLPLNRFTSWPVVEPEVNVKHCYQVGAGPIWWFVGQFLTGNTHDPKDVFNRTQEEFNRGNHPVVCIAQNYDFGGKPHCILPVRWDKSSKPWRMTICDPNLPNQLKTLTVDPDSNEFRYVGSDTYSGGAWSGGRFHYMPYSLLNTSPRTPVWDAIVLILSGVLIVLASDGETESLTDGNGRDLHGHGNRARQLLQAGDTLSGFFVPFKGYDEAERASGKARTAVRGARAAAGAKRPYRPRGRGTVAGEILMRRALDFGTTVPGLAGTDLGVLATLPLGELAATRSMRTLRAAVSGEDGRHGKRPALQPLERTLRHVVNDPAAMRELAAETRKLLRDAARASLPGDFRHSVVGLRRGAFGYAVKHGLSEFRLESSQTTGERTRLSVDRLGTSANVVAVKVDRDKTVKVQAVNKLGVAGDYLQLTVDRVPAATAADLQLNFKPGLGGVDLLTNGQRIDARIEVQARLGQQIVRRAFELPVEGGVRLKLAHVLSQSQLGVAAIDQLFGPSKTVQIVSSQL